MLDKNILHNQKISRRTFIIGFGKIGLLVLLGCRLLYMQFIKKNEYKTLSDKNRIRIIAIPPTRGQIFDRNNKIMATNKTCFNLYLEKNANHHFIDEVNQISQLLDLDLEQHKELIKKVHLTGNIVPAIIIDFLQWHEVSAIEEKRSKLKSIFVDTGYVRHYPEHESCSHLLGYLGASDTKIKNFRIGKTGLEKQYNKIMQGQFGHKQIEVNAHGKYIRSLATTESIPGQDITLNINLTIQKEIQKILHARSCSAVLMDCTNGGIIAINSSPAYNANEFIKLSKKYWNSLITNPYHPLINKAIQSLYPPGSIFKIVVILAALEKGHDPMEKIYCTGQAALGGNKFRCPRRRGHGALTLEEAVQSSCNSYIYALAQRIGANPIIEMAKKLGLGTITGIDLPDEKAGFVPTAKWKKTKYKTSWTRGDSLNLSIGQGFLLVTPLQLTRMIATIASNGKLFTPQILTKNAQFIQLDIKQHNLDIVKSSLYKVMNQYGGTGYFSRMDINGMRMSGKTGTAQVQAKKNANDDLSRENIDWHSRNHGIFVGYAPHDNPKYAVCVYSDHAGSGSKAAAPLAKQIMTLALKCQS